MPAVPNEAFGVFLSSSPPAISATAFAGCFLWDGAGLQPLASRRAARSRLSSSRFVAQGDSTEGDVLGGWSASGDRGGSKFDCDSIFSRSVASPAASLLPGPCEPLLPASVRSRLKKRVTFADHLGFDLEAVKVIQEEPDSPPPGLCYSPTATTPSLPAQRPQQLPPFSAAATDLKLAAAQRQPGFRADFPQPVSNYATFKACLHARCVALENVTVDSIAPYLVSVTIKVKNVSFEKHVFVRATRNGWKSHRDFAATYHSTAPDCFGSGSSAGSSVGGAVLPSATLAEVSPYDTFLLRADLAGSLDAAGFVSPVEFAVCFRASGGVEYWDNNDGSNYRLVVDYGPASGDRNGAVGSLPCEEQDVAVAGNSSSSESASRDSWTSFAAWRTISPEVPYW